MQSRRNVLARMDMRRVFLPAPPGPSSLQRLADLATNEEVVGADKLVYTATSAAAL
jgi:hypothetical protein